MNELDALVSHHLENIQKTLHRDDLDEVQKLLTIFYHSSLLTNKLLHEKYIQFGKVTQAQEEQV
jgi:hypothetical protein